MAAAEDVLVSFRAGLMKPENNTLKADQRKGQVQLVQVCNAREARLLTCSLGSRWKYRLLRSLKTA